jgi:hypothetical protein
MLLPGVDAYDTDDRLDTGESDLEDEEDALLDSLFGLRRGVAGSFGTTPGGDGEAWFAGRLTISLLDLPGAMVHLRA